MLTDLDPRIRAGMREQLAVRDERLRDGDEQIGWKVGFGSPSAAAALGIDRPLVGFLVRSRLLADGADVPVGTWANPALEGEVAVHLGRDVGPDDSWDDVRAAVGGVSAAIELADIDPPPEDVAAILAGDIFHRHVLLGPVLPPPAGLGGFPAQVLADGKPVASTADSAAATGDVVEVVRLTAETLAACGERLRAGEVVICGSVVPPQPVAAGQRVEVELGPLGRLAVRLTA